MRIIRRLLRKMFWLLVLTGCQTLVGGDDAPFAFSVRADSVVEGDSLVVSIDIEKGPIEGYTLDWDICHVDVASGKEYPIKEDLWYGPFRVEPTNLVSFPNDGHADLYFKNLASGTYRVTLHLSKENYEASRSCIAVVAKKSGDDPGGEPDDPNPDDPNPDDPNPDDPNPDDPPVQEVPVEDFTLPELNAVYGRLEIKSDAEYRFTPVVSPQNASDKSFSTLSSDENVVEASCESGTLILKAKAPGKASVSITSDGGQGITKSLPVIVYADVKVKVEFEELDASEAQLRTKTFPCKLRFTSNSAYPFDSPLVYSITAKAVVNRSGYDSQEVEDRRDVQVKGNRTAYYDLTANLLIPAYNIWRTTEYSYSISLGMVLDNPLDKDVWRLTFDEPYKTQSDTRIWPYLTLVQQ